MVRVLCHVWRRCTGGRERKRERDRDRERVSVRERETERQRDRETERQKIGKDGLQNVWCTHTCM